VTVEVKVSRFLLGKGFPTELTRQRSWGRYIE